MLMWPAMLTAQSFSFSMPNSNFVLIPGGGFESKAWVGVEPGDTVVLTASGPQELFTFFQPSVVYQDQFVYLIVISPDSTFPPFSQVDICAVQNTDTIHKSIYITRVNDSTGFNLYDSAWYYLDSAFQYLKASFPAQQAFFDSLHQFPWITCFPYPPLLIVTHHLIVYGNWRAEAMWHNMIPPDDWGKAFIYNEVTGDCWGVFFDTWGIPSLIPCEIMHYNQQDSIVSSPENTPPDLIKTWPNPACEGIWFSLPEQDCMGRDPELRSSIGLPVPFELFSYPGNMRYLSLAHLPEGVYLLTIHGRKNTNTAKIIHTHCH